MLTTFRCFLNYVAGSCLAIALSQTGFAAGPAVLNSSTQLIVVTTANWDAVDGQLRMYQRASRNLPWRAVGATVPIVVGKGGMGWGIGVMSLDPLRSPVDPAKREGDHKSPAGIFRLGDAFGYAATAPQGLKMHYLPIKTSTDCVDDPQSRYYNQVLDRESRSPDWNSAEHMRDAGEAYRWGVIVNHNAERPQPYGGSCVFLHIWSGPRHGTEGCTAMPEAQILALLGHLDPAAHPLLVEMPLDQYRRFTKDFALPAQSADDKNSNR